MKPVAMMMTVRRNGEFFKPFFVGVMALFAKFRDKLQFNFRGSIEADMMQETIVENFY